MWDATGSLKNRIWSTLLLGISVSVLFLYNWTIEAARTAHVEPEVERCDISEILQRKEGEKLLSEADWQLLCEQTGLGEAVIEKLILAGREQELFDIQNIYFAPVVIEEFRTTPITVSEWLAEKPVSGYEGMPIVDIQDGDILITKNSRFLGWRNGHAGLVVDAENGLVLEAIMLGSPSQLCRISKWERYPSFMVLRLREEYMLPEETAEILYNTTATDVGENDFKGTVAEDVAAYASEHLVGVSYQLLAGVFSRNLYQMTEEEAATSTNVANVANEALSGTQCAHLVWYAYRQFGIDLDSDGGLFVTPYDIRNSPYLEIIQSYGY